MACAVGNSINIYDPYKFEVVQSFPSSHSGTITSLVWMDDFNDKDVY